MSTANTTVLDWNKAKRPLKYILNRFSKGSIPILIRIAREELKKVGVVYNAVKDTDYEMNRALHFMMEGGRWRYEVTKAQDELVGMFPPGGSGVEPTIEKLLYHASTMEGEAFHETAGESDNLPDEIATTIAEKTKYPHTSEGLIQHANEKGKYTDSNLGAVLKEARFTEVNPVKWHEMVKAVDKVITIGIKPEPVGVD